MLWIFLFFIVNSSWWNVNWLKRRPIIVENLINDTLNEYQIKIKIPHFEGIQSDWKDVRFIQGNTELWHWVESSTNDTAIYWVKLKNPLLPLSNDIIWLYYANPQATVSEKLNGDSTFIIYDDFNEPYIDTSKWIVNTGVFVNADSSYLYLYNGILTAKNKVFSKGEIKLRAKVRPLTNDNVDRDIGFRLFRQTQEPVIVDSGYLMGFNIDDAPDIIEIGKWTPYQSIKKADFPIDTSKWYILSTWKDTNDSLFLRVNDSVSIGGYDVSFSDGYVGFFTAADGKAYLDWFIVRKYAKIEPSVSIGEEQVNAFLYNIEIFDSITFSFDTICNPTLGIIVEGENIDTLIIAEDSLFTLNFEKIPVTDTDTVYYNLTSGIGWKKVFAYAINNSGVESGILSDSIYAVAPSIDYVILRDYASGSSFIANSPHILVVLRNVRYNPDSITYSEFIDSLGEYQVYLTDSFDYYLTYIYPNNYAYIYVKLKNYFGESEIYYDSIWCNFTKVKDKDLKEKKFKILVSTIQKEKLKMLVLTLKETYLRIKIFDINGALVLEENKIVKTGKNYLKYTLKPGIYFIEVDVNDKNKILKRKITILK